MPITVTSSTFTTSGTLQTGQSYIMNANVSLGAGDINKYLNLGSGTTFDGAGYTITITGWSNGNGLFLLSHSTSLIKDLRITTTSSSLNNQQGWFTRNGSTGQILRCSTNGPAPAYGACIAGKDFTGTITDCYATGTLSNDSGGIVKDFSGLSTVDGCYYNNNSSALPSGAGGICGSGNQGQGSTITCCFANVNLSSGTGGGIYGVYANNIIIINCYTVASGLGTVGSQCGGIVGAFPVASVTVSYCFCSYSGSMSTEGGSIVGNRTDTNAYQPTVTNCVGVNNMIEDEEGYVPSGSSNTLSSLNNALLSGWSSSVWQSAPTFPMLKCFQDGTVWQNYTAYNTYPTHYGPCVPVGVTSLGASITGVSVSPTILTITFTLTGIFYSSSSITASMTYKASGVGADVVENTTKTVSQAVTTIPSSYSAFRMSGAVLYRPNTSSANFTVYIKMQPSDTISSVTVSVVS